MKNCKNCKHLVAAKPEPYSGPRNHCNEVLSHLSLEISSGWEGYSINNVEIDEPDEFSCSAHEPIRTKVKYR